MPAKRVWSEAELEVMRKVFHTDLPNKQVGKLFGCDYNRSIKPYWVECFGAKKVHDRFRRLCSISKSGDKNPMKGRTKHLHHNYTKEYVNWQGYRFVDIPDWFTGKHHQGKVMEHVVVGCEKYGLTELPPGHVFHHIDEDKLNNDPANLQLLTISEHMRVHAALRRASGV